MGCLRKNILSFRTRILTKKGLHKMISLREELGLERTGKGQKMICIGIENKKETKMIGIKRITKSLGKAAGREIKRNKMT